MAESTEYPLCSVCLEGFARDGDKCPKLLPCSHTLCLSCLRQLSRANSLIPLETSFIECPECRVSHKVPQVTGPTGFPTNRYVLHTLDLETKITELENNAVKPFLCQVHQKPCVMFCLKKDCWLALCPKCPAQEHQEHNLVSLAECIQESQELNGIKQDVVDTKILLDVYEKQLREARQIVLEKQAEANKGIDETSTELKLMIDRKSKELKEKVQESCNSEQAYLEAILDKIPVHIGWGTNIENDIANRSERNISKRVKQLITFQGRCTAFKALARLERLKWKSYNVVHLQKYDNQVEHSSLIGDVFTKLHKVSRFEGQQRIFLDTEKSASAQTASDRRASCVPVIQRSTGCTNIGLRRQPCSLDGIHRSIPY